MKQLMLEECEDGGWLITEGLVQDGTGRQWACSSAADAAARLWALLGVEEKPPKFEPHAKLDPHAGDSGVKLVPRWPPPHVSSGSATASTLRCLNCAKELIGPVVICDEEDCPHRARALYCGSFADVQP